ncbi:carboxymuconolactone decarboxylase family protein [Streptomyces jumonjinensis]|uniref:Alkylhydroperoxidase n=1 Tax=Streptomyces jumonjinensis TaxID=1945 RepID=A0A646KRJ1_STRJU|nr:carboxymuconolactone decarboxylase family protein [Streptomyces jumonjinensis]MQT04720.1 alkylhydroperoxidase [Streptomyces jumonjinensis]
MRPVVRAVLRGALRQVRYVKAVPPGAAQGTVAEVYAQVERDFGVLAPPLALHSPAPAPLAASWLLLRETLLVDGVASRAAKELTATAVSAANSCSYCVDVHQATLETLGAERPLPGGPDAALADWAAASGRIVRGGGSPAVPPELAAGAAGAAEIFGVAVAFHYLNRMVGVFLADSPVPDRAPDFARGPILRTVARTMRPVVPEPLQPGASLPLLAGAPLPAGLAWARGNPAVADALGRAVAAVDEAAHWVSGPVRERLRERLDGWDGGRMGPTRAWLIEALAGLPTPERPAARLALLTAFAPYQVIDADVAALRERHPTDREVIELTSWAALTTATRVGARLTAPRTAAGR